MPTPSLLRNLEKGDYRTVQGKKTIQPQYFWTKAEDSRPSWMTLDSDEQNIIVHVSTPIDSNRVHQNVFDIKDKIIGFSELKENWDYMGAIPPRSDIIVKALGLVKRLEFNNQDIFFAAPSPGGDIMLELQNKSKAIEIEFLEQGDSEYAFYDKNDLIQEGNLEEISILDMKNWLYS